MLQRGLEKSLGTAVAALQRCQPKFCIYTVSISANSAEHLPAIKERSSKVIENEGIGYLGFTPICATLMEISMNV